MVAERLPYVTPEEYLAREREAEHKSEYLSGEIYAMAGASEAHITISSNVGAELRDRLKRRPCRSYSNDMRVRVDQPAYMPIRMQWWSVEIGASRIQAQRRSSIQRSSLRFRLRARRHGTGV